MSKKYYTLRNDAVFKNIFYRDLELLKQFLTSILGYFYPSIKIDKVEIKNVELTKDRLYIKNKVIDILVYIDGKVINIELNNNNYPLTIKIRNLTYLLSALITDVQTGIEYQVDREYLQINFNFQKSRKKGFSSYYLREDEDHEDILLENIRIININVDYFMDEWYNSDKSEDYFKRYKFIILFGMNREELLRIKDDDWMIKKVREDVEKLNQDETFYQLFTDEEDREMLNKAFFKDGYNQGIEKGIEEGIEEGIEQGSLNEKRKIIKNMIQENYSIDDIAKITKLSKNEIETLNN